MVRQINVHNRDEFNQAMDFLFEKGYKAVKIGLAKSKFTKENDVYFVNNVPMQKAVTAYASA